MANKTVRIQCMLEPELAECLEMLADKLKTKPSIILRSLLIDELREHGLLPNEYAIGILKGMVRA